MKLIKIFIIASIVPGFLVAGPAEKKGLEIAIKSDKSNTGFKGESSTMTMTLINAHGEKTIRRMTSKILEGRRDGDKSMTEFLWPADVKETKMLTWTHKRRSDDQWLFLPSLKRVKRINSRSKTGSFMGSEFSYEDLGSQEVEKYTYKFIREEKPKGRPCWVTERYPTDKKSGYSKQVIWTDKEYLAPTRIDYYDRKNSLLKTARFSGMRKLQGFWRARKLHMVNHQTSKESILGWKKRKLKVRFRSSDFDPDNLED